MQSFAPGKLIISGEHAVVHGAPALALAVDLGAEASFNIQPDQPQSITVSMAKLGYKRSYNMTELYNLYSKLTRNYAQFQAGSRAVNKIMQEPAELLWYALALAIFSHGVNIAGALQIEITASIPVGCGMGASAAITAALLAGLFAAAEKQLSTADLYALVHTVEKLQHGNSSGIDPCVVTHGGQIKFQNGKFTRLEAAPLPYYFINTGQPQSSTGECVKVSSLALQDKQLLQSFYKVTENLIQALLCAVKADFLTQIRHNHRLLCAVGVVPEATQQLVAAIEAAGGAAKICGAGSVVGDQAGMLLVMGAEQVVAAAGYKQLNFSMCMHGAYAIDLQPII